MLDEGGTVGVTVKVIGLPVTVVTYRDGVGVHDEELEDELAVALEIIAEADVLAVLDEIEVGMVIVGLGTFGVVIADEALDVNVTLEVVGEVDCEGLKENEDPPEVKSGRDDGLGAELDDVEGV